MQALALLSPNTLQMASPNGLEEELYLNILGFLVKPSSVMLGFGLKVIWKALVTLLINNHVGQTKLLSKHLDKSLHTFSAGLHRHQLAAGGPGSLSGEAQGNLT